MISNVAKVILRILGWKIVGNVPKEIKKAVIIMAPHTSNWDFVYGQLALQALTLPVRYFAKKELFFFPLSLLLRGTGGVPINRSKSSNMVKEAATLFDVYSPFYIIITPEGTRSRVDKWKTGFYYLAKEAKVPILLSFIDFEKKELGVAKIIEPSGDLETDFRYIQDFYSSINPKYPEKYNPVIFKK